MKRRNLFQQGWVATAVAITCLVGSHPWQAVAQEPITIDYWHINTESFGGPAVKELVAEFEKRNPGIRVKEQFQPNVYTGLLQNLQVRLAVNNPPDVAQIGWLYMDYATTNFPFKSMDELVQKYNGQSLISALEPNILKLATRDGKLLGMPYSLSNPVTYYNNDLLKAAGLDPNKPPQTWEQWAAAAKQIKEKTGKPGIYLRTVDDNWVTQGLIESNGGKVISCKGGKVQATYDSPESAQAIQTWADMVKNGSALNVLNVQGEQTFLAGEVAAYVSTIAQRDNLQKNARFALRATTFPTFGNRKPQIPSGGNALVVFSQDPKKQEASFKFIQFLMSPEGFAIWTKGTGYIPLHKDSGKALGDFLLFNPIQRVAVQQMPLMVSWATFPGKDGLAAQQSLFRATQKALSGQTTAEAALKESAAEANRLLAGETCKP